MKRHSLAYQKVTKILDLSKDFQKHRKNILTIQNSSKYEKIQNHRIFKIEKLKEEKQRYYYNAQSFRLNQLQRQNNKIVDRLEQISKRDPRKLIKSNSHLSLGSMKSLIKTNSSKSLYKDIKKSQSKRILKENEEIAERIIRSKSPKNLGFQRLKKEYEQEQRYVESISRYSEKNKKMLTSIIKKGLKMKDNQIGFLPNILKSQSNTRGLISFKK